MKRKILCLLLAISIISTFGSTSFASIPEVVDIYDNYLCLYETFEENTIDDDLASGKIVASGVGNTIAYTDGASGSKGAARLIYEENMSSINFRLKLIPEQKYRISAWVKLNDISLVSNAFHFIYYCATETGTNGYWRFSFSDVEFKTNEWVYINKEITLPSMIYVVGAPDEPVDTNAVGSIGIRFGANGEFSNIEGASGPYDFSVDDFIIEPVVNDNSSSVNDEIVLDKYGWSSDFPRTRVEATDGTNVVPPESVSGSSQRITAKSTEYVGIYRNISELWHNRAYKIGLWARADLTSGASGGEVCIIAYNSSGNGKDSRIEKWPRSSSGQALTSEWRYYEWIYFQGLNTFDERVDSKVEFRSYIYNGSGSYVYMSDMKVEPLDIVYQDAVNYGIIDKDTVVGNAGWYFVDESKLEKDSSYETAYRMINTTDSLKQHVQIKDGKKYKISFKAKAESYVDANGTTVNVGSDVQSVPVYAVLDRSGNTKYVGDWSADADYQYISGNPLTKDDAWSAAQANANAKWNLTDEWKEFSGVYTWDYQGENYRMPLLSFAVGDAANPATATWSIADVEIEEVKDSVIKVENVDIEGSLVEGTQINLSYDYESFDTEEGISYVRILTGSDSSGWITRDIIKASEFCDYTIPEELGGQMKIEILPIDYSGNVGVLYSEPYDVEKIFDIKTENVTWGTNEFSGSVRFIENRSNVSGKKYVVVIALYTADNTMLSTYQSIPVEVSTGYNNPHLFNLPTNDTVAKARIFVWGGTNILGSDMIAHTDVWEFDRP